AGTGVEVVLWRGNFVGAVVECVFAGLVVFFLQMTAYEIGERQTSACAVPEGWLRTMGAERSLRAVLPDMTFTTPHGTVRYRLPWRWAAFDYRTLCEDLYAQCDARFETAKVNGRTGFTVHTDRGHLHAPLI